MGVKELRKKRRSELSESLRKAREELVRFRLDRKLGSLADGSKLMKKRKEIARILTVLREKEILAIADSVGEKTSRAEKPKTKDQKSK